MQALLVAMGLLMWMWGAASLALVRVLLPAAQGPARSAWLVLAVLIGGGGLVALAQLVLPGSVLSQGWSRETLQAAQQGTLAVAVLVGAAAAWHGHRRLAGAPGAAGGHGAAGGKAPAGKAKRRP